MSFIEVFLFCAVLYYFYNISGINMVELLSNRLQDVYARWETPTGPFTSEENSPRLSLDGLRRAGLQSQRKRSQIREQARKVRESSLFKIKESELLLPPAVFTNSQFHRCCPTCTPTSRDSFIDAAARPTISGKNILLVDPQPGLISKVFKHFWYMYNLQKYDYPVVTQTVLNDERLKDAIRSAALEQVHSENISEEKAYYLAEKRAINILKKMESRISNTLFRFTGWVMFKLLSFFIKSVVVQPYQLDVIKEANKSGVPLVFLPLHRSHLDYILMSFMRLTHNIRNCLIAAGDNLQLPFFGNLLSGLGAFYIKRKIDSIPGKKDILYRETLHTYVMESLRAGHNFEFFIEGGRTRTGKTCMPKGGILSIIVDAVIDGTIEDALLIPVSINYERLVDGNFVKEQLGQAKAVETFSSAMRAIWKTLRGNYGIVKINICEPFSLKEMIQSLELKISRSNTSKIMEKGMTQRMSTSSLLGSEMIDDEHRLLVDSLARHIVYDSSKSIPIMSTNIVAFLLLNKFRYGCSLDKLVMAFDELRLELESKNKDLAFCGENIDIINHALKILGPGLVQQKRQKVTNTLGNQVVKTQFITTIEPISILPNIIELAYYSNTMTMHYVMDSIVISALYGALKLQINDPKLRAENDITVYQNTLIDKSLKLCDILKYEFIYSRPCQDVEQIIIETIQNLVYCGIISQIEEGLLEEERWGRRYAKNFDDSSDEENAIKNATRKIRFKLDLAPESADKMQFLHTILRPLIDTYTISAFTLRKLVGRSLGEKEFIQEILTEIKTNIDSGIAAYGESLSVDPIKNSLKVFEKWGVLECYIHENSRIYYLKEEYDNDKAINDIYESVEVFKWLHTNN
ncbi:hypothetical protein HCN44_010039 [Aphidius gifuensis]|uniref:Phospholipid/glycerol acyltransferase domain-containing protein n=3 Tax=Aphidius gifuensis TaxID=684658 RepID=A0A834XYE9_APHGI|nr:glycerol-3-phosphate acyltransferase 1, mitochondrial isoform X1 [Aphidius gifuensis]KAF7993444.1 hypothetical protein HCN44_010039 [Aphidius gifuensis]